MSVVKCFNINYYSYYSLMNDIRMTNGKWLYPFSPIAFNMLLTL
ncbi:hypothetical protein [Enterococcus phage vB_Efm3_KEN20]